MLKTSGPLIMFDRDVEIEMGRLSALAERVREMEGSSDLYYAINRAWHQLFEVQKKRAAQRS